MSQIPLVWRWLGGLSLLAAGAAALLMLALWLWQERLLFQPTPLAPDVPLARDPDVHESTVEVPGARLSVLELRLPNPDGVVFFLHGNAGNLASWFVNPDFYRRANHDLVMMDYRGYGKSTGRIESEAQLHADVQVVWERVSSRYAGRRVVIYGRSLGTGLAAALAARVQPHLTLLVSPYSSMVALAGLHYAWVPSGLLRYPLRTDQALAQVKTPVLLLHGERDTLIPPAQSRLLLPLAASARLVIVDGASHNDLQEFEPYLRAVFDALVAR